MKDVSQLLIRKKGKRSLPPGFSWVTICVQGYRFKLLVVTILCFHRQFLCKPIIDTASITNPLSVPMSRVCRVLLVLRDPRIWLKSVRFNQLYDRKSRLLEPFLSEKRGPNGVSYLGVERDLQGLFYEPLLFISITIELVRQ
jgi:hypothetical protein